MKRSLKIDFLRGFCMIYITAVFHLSQYMGNNYYLNNNIYGNSFMWSCLGTFSLLSGYLLGGKYICNTIKNTFVFLKKRFIRIYPLFLLSTICLYLIDFNDQEQSLYALLGLAPFVSHSPSTLWYVSMILLFYLLTPLVIVKNRKSRLVRSLLILIIFFVISRIIYIDFRFIYNLTAFLFGVCIAGYKTIITKIQSLKIIYYVIIAIYILAFFYLDQKSNFLFIIVDFLGIAFLLIFADIIKIRRFSKYISLLSYLSLSYYLFHRFTYWVFLSIYKPEGFWVLFTYLLFVAVPVGMLVSYIIQKRYDATVNSFILHKKYSDPI